MKNLLFFVVTIACDTRGPRPTAGSREAQNITNQESDYVTDYGELDIANTLMDLFQTQQFTSNVTFEPGDKIRVLSNIVKIELDDSQTENAKPASMTQTSYRQHGPESTCERKVFVIPSHTYTLIFLNILTFILTTTTFISSLILISQNNRTKRNDVYYRAEQPCPHEHVSLTSCSE